MSAATATSADAADADAVGATRSPRITEALLDGLAARVSSRPGAASVVVDAPVTGEPIVAVPTSTPDDVLEAAATARAAQPAWAARPIGHRAQVLRRFHDLLLERQDEVMDLLQLETGKARRHAFDEVFDVATTARYYANTAGRYLKRRRRKGAMPGLTSVWEEHPALGVVGVIGPWNYPLILTISDALPALVAGNGVVLKPDSKTPLCALWAASLLEEAGLPPGLLRIVVGEGPVLGPAIVEHTDFVHFTGSTAVGREVAERCASRLIGSSLELGGKNAMIVLDDADLDRAVDGALHGCFANAGQLCMSMERLLVHEDVVEPFLAAFVARTQAMVLDGDRSYATDLGCLISEEHLARVQRYVDGAVAGGARVLTGGRARPDLGPRFFEPTILADVGDDAACRREEVFGPVVAVTTFTSVDAAVAAANDSDYGLTFSIWSRSRRRGLAVASRLEAGTVNVNEAWVAAWASIDAPMGGFKSSGLGRRHGRPGIVKYTETRTVARQRLRGIAPPAGHDAHGYARQMTGTLRLLRRAPRGTS